MKTILFAFLFLLIPKLCISQTEEISKKDAVVYIDSMGITSTKDDYKYIRIIKDYKTLKVEPYQVREYYKSGKIALIGAIKSKLDYVRTGTFLSFYENGNRKTIENYTDNKLVGIYFEFYENGEKKWEAENVEVGNMGTSQKKINQFWDINGNQKVTDGNGFLEFQEKNESEKGEIKNGFKNGVWEGHEFDLSYKETYDNGKLISGISTDKTLATYSYTELVIYPKPAKGIDDFLNHIAKNFNSPNIEGLKGKIYVTFFVEIDGSISNIKVLKDIGYDTGNEAVRAVKGYKGWTSGEQRGRKARCAYSLPISIQSAN